MKKILLPFLISVLTLSLSAQLKSGYVPFHQLLQNKHGDIQNHGNQRAIAYEEIGYLHLTPNNNTWIYADSGVFTYTSQAWETGGLYTTFADPNWDTTAQFTVVTDTIGLVQSVTGQTFNTATHSYTNSYRYVYTYYSSNNYVNTQTLQGWDGASWVDSVGYTYTYNSNNFLTNTVAQKGNPLQNDSQYVYTYAGYNNTQVLNQVWVSGAWASAFKVNNSFDANGNKYQSFGSSWTGSTWVNYDLFIQGFDLNNNAVSYLYELWNSTTGTYVNNYQEAYAYVLGNNTRFENYNWDTTAAAWTPNILYTFSYDNNNNVTYELDQSYQNGAFANTDQYFYYYSGFTVSGIKQIANHLTVSLFPNPSTGNATISFTADKPADILLNVYDADGNLLKQQRTWANAGLNQMPVNLAGFAAGNYFVQIVNSVDGKTGVLKLVKQ